MGKLELGTTDPALSRFGVEIDLLSDDYFMGQALREARKAYAATEVPIGHDGWSADFSPPPPGGR